MRCLTIAIVLACSSAGLSAAEVKTRLELAVAAPCTTAAQLTTGAYAVDAISFGVSAKPTGTITLVERGTATVNADFFGIKMVPGGVTLGIVISLDQPFTPLPPSDATVEIARIRVFSRDAVTLALTDTLGSPPVDVVMDSGGTTIPPEEIELGPAIVVPPECPPPPSGFVRGDANQDARIDISDAIYISRALFGMVSDQGCPDALDTNNDEVLDPGDPIYLLRFLFLEGAPIPAPVPANLRDITGADCAKDPSGDALRCVSYEPCEF